MWDEKKFFEDYVNESEKIKPDDRFIEQMKNLAAQEERKKKPVPIIKYAAVAASFLLCIGLGGVVWHNQNTVPEEKNIGTQVELQAGQQVEEAGIIENVLDGIKQGAVIRDEAGNEISQSQQEELYQSLKNARAVEEPAEGQKVNSYFLEGEQTIEIEIWEDNFLKIDGKWYR